MVLFDGVCHLCNRAVNFLIARDPARRLRFAALQSEAGARLLRRFAIAGDALDTVVLIERGAAHTRSSAFLRALAHLRGPWRVLAWLRVVPRALRDLLYDWVARNRYRWFGVRGACRIPSPEERDRFL